MKDTERLQAAIAHVAAAGPEIGSIWRHRTGGVYRVTCCAIREADLVPVVVYCDEYPAGKVFDKRLAVTWTRPLVEFADGRFSLMKSAPKAVPA